MSELRIKLRIYAKLFHQKGGAFDYAMRAGPVSANHTAMLSVSARTIFLRCFWHVRDRHFYFQQFAPIKTCSI